ncbi:MAG: N-acetylmuramoyl-L-alanine amidase [Xanthomonadales bacterium]|jgi:N-acetylmuramoyl-L-alanine amidase|nr:N-acetylmuramoyl-L-alanine amidase [Xanthomonadales bacterium]
MIRHAELPYEPLPYVERLAERDVGDISLAVIHCTELPDLATAREYGEVEHYAASGTGNSGHFYIDRDGSMQQWVPLERIAHHVRDHNADSIGIELVNRGRYPDWWDSTAQDRIEPYPATQVEALVFLLRWLRHTLPSLKAMAGHEHLDRARVPATDDPTLTVRRKRDPGPGFPWDQVLEGSGLTLRIQKP